MSKHTKWFMVDILGSLVFLTPIAIATKWWVYALVLGYGVWCSYVTYVRMKHT